MRPVRLVIAALFALVGIVWLLQGLNIIGGSAMSGSPVWAIVGAILIAGAVTLVVIERRRAA